MDPEDIAAGHMIVIQYEALSRHWQITGFVSAQADQDNSETALFYKIVRSIHHEEVAMIPPSPSPVVAAAVPVEYKNPRLAIEFAVRDLGLGSSHTISLTENVDMFPDLYHIMAADVGGFREDTGGFYPWLKDYLAGQFGLIKPAPCEGYWQKRQQQVWAALYVPDSEIGRKMRQIEAGLDPARPYHGALSYWHYLVGPALYACGGATPNNTREQIMETQFNNLLFDYIYASQHGTLGSVSTFGDYLAQRKWTLTGFTDTDS